MSRRKTSPLLVQSATSPRQTSFEPLEHRRLLASLSGFAFIDTDGDGRRGAGDHGLPGVLIELHGQAIPQFTATTDDGFYAFTNLEAGNYRVVAHQPEAVGDGDESAGYPGARLGEDEISNIELSESDSATEINFGEGAIKPHYISPIWVLSSSTSGFQSLLREVVLGAEQVAGNVALAEQIRELAEGNIVAKPVATLDKYTVVSGEDLVVASTDGLLQNDFNPTSDSMTVEIVEPPSNGTLSLNDDGSFSYQANRGFAGLETFSYVAVGSRNSLPADVNIEVTPPPNRPPTTVPDAYTLEEDTVLSVVEGVLENDFDSDVDSLSVRALSQPASGILSLLENGSFTYTPFADFFGEDSFTYAASDGELESVETLVTLTVTSVNDAPQSSDDAYFTNEDESLAVESVDGVLANDADIDGDVLRAVLEGAASNGTVNLEEDGGFTYTPNPGFSGLDSFSYVTNDGKTSSTPSTVTIDVGSVNDAPIANADQFSTDEDVTLVAANVSVLSNDTDADGDALTATIQQEPANGDLTLNTDGTFTYVPNPNFSGTDSFVYIASDGLRNSQPATAMITVVAVNDPPIAVADEYALNQGETLLVDQANGVLSNDNDVESNSLTTTLAIDASQGQLSLDANGGFEFIPPSDFSGNVTFSYRANDGLADSEVAVVTLVVNQVNTAPDAVADEYAVDQDTVLNIDAPNGVLSNDIDAEGDNLSADLVTQPENGSVALGADGSFQYTPTAGFNGIDSFSYAANDGIDASTPISVSITVRPVSVTVTETVTLGASKDNSLFESATGNLSNGSGEYLFVGKTLQAENFLRRGLIAFDFAAIPQGATITDVSLTLNMSRTIVGAFDVTLHRVTQNWGEGASDALAEEGIGIEPAANDATWLHTFFNSQFWSTPGGDFTTEASASTSVDGNGFYTWSSDQLVADVQRWLDDPTTNAGWLLLTDESDITAKRFDSRENSTPANRPRLVVEYEFSSVAQRLSASELELESQAASEPADTPKPADLMTGDTNGDGAVNFQDFLKLASNFGDTDAAFAAEDGDFDGDSIVGFSDFLLLAQNFGLND